MSYRSSIEIAGVCSVIVHLAIISGIGYRLQHREDTPAPAPPTMVIALRPPDPAEEEQVKRLIDSGAPAQHPVESADTDLISEQDTQAQDNSPEEGEGLQPTSETTAEFDELGLPEPILAEPVPPAPIPPESAAPAPPPTVVEQPQLEANTAPPMQESPERVTVARALDKAPLPATEQLASAPSESEPEPEVAAEPEPEEESPSEPFQMAQYPIPLQPVIQNIDSTRTRENGGAKDEGPLSFEANKHELGEYMLRVRQLIKLEWRRGLQIRYRGAGPAEAVVKFGISPTGQLVFANVIEQGASITYAAMCKGAIEAAGPFPPFPFEIPAEYRTRNLEVQIKFNYR